MRHNVIALDCSADWRFRRISLARLSLNPQWQCPDASCQQSDGGAEWVGKHISPRTVAPPAKHAIPLYASPRSLQAQRRQQQQDSHYRSFAHIAKTRVRSRHATLRLPSSKQLPPLRAKLCLSLLEGGFAITQSRRMQPHHHPALSATLHLLLASTAFVLARPLPSYAIPHAQAKHHLPPPYQAHHKAHAQPCSFLPCY